MAKGKDQANAYLKEALRIIAVLLAAGALFGLVFLISRCGSDRNEAPPVHSATMDEVRITDEETGISYIRCPLGIGANTLKDAFLTIGSAEKGVTLYTVAFEDSARFISEAKDALGGSYVYRAESVPEIRLEDFAPVSAGIFMGGINQPIDYFYGKEAGEEASVEDGTRYVEYIKDAILGGREAEPTGEFTDKEYYIRLYSEAFPGLYYEVVFCTDVNGVCYLRDMVTEKLYLSPDGLTARITG